MAYNKDSLNFVTQSKVYKNVLAQVETVTDAIAAQADAGDFTLKYTDVELAPETIDLLTDVGLFLEVDVTVGSSVVGYYTRTGNYGSYVYSAASGNAVEGTTYYTQTFAGLGYSVTSMPATEFTALTGPNQYEYNNDYDYYYLVDTEYFAYSYKDKDWSPSGLLYEYDGVANYYLSEDPAWIAGKKYYELVGTNTYVAYTRPVFYIKEDPYYIISWL